MQICNSAEKQPGQEVRRIVEATTIMEWHLLEKIRKAASLQKEVASFEPRIKEVKDAIVAAALDNEDLAEEGSITYIVDGILCRVSSGYDYRIPPESTAALQKLLGNRFYDLVDVAVEYRPTPRLIEMACDGDLSPEIRKHLSIRLRAPSVSIIQETGKQESGR